jgi:hypothetical protein
MSDKKLILLKTKIDDEEIEYTGRFLGFIKEDEFNALCQSTPEVSTKLESKATQDLIEVSKKFDNMTGYRLVMTVKKVGDKSVLKKTLFVSEDLDIITEVKPALGTDPGQVRLQSNNGTNDIIVQETA